MLLLAVIGLLEQKHLLQLNKLLSSNRNSNQFHAGEAAEMHRFNQVSIKIPLG